MGERPTGGSTPIPPGRAFKTRKRAQAEHRRLLGIIERDGDPFPNDIVFALYVSRWLEHKLADGLRATTAHRYECMLRDDILPFVGRLELRKIKPAHVRAFLKRMSARGLAPSTVTQARAVFRGIMQQAVADGLIETNPVTAIKRPRMARPDKAVPSPEQIKMLMELSQGTEMEIPILLGATTALRRSEVSGLLWSDIDLLTRG
jgi:integrase